MRLESEGHQVCVGMDASGGMMLAAREKPDLITLDFQMPAGDGGKVYTRLRTNTITARTPIIFITGMGAHELESLSSDPTVRILQKPIDMADLKRLIAELLGKPAPSAPKAPAAPPPSDNDSSGGDVLDLDA
jgi:two-component system phosphate regulon response regulator PhoB